MTTTPRRPLLGQADLRTWETELRAGLPDQRRASEVRSASLGEPEGIEALVHEVLDRVGVPVDVWAVAATLESLGLRDVDALRYGEVDIFGLAGKVHGEARRWLTGTGVGRPGIYLPSMGTRVRQFGRLYLKGLLASLPMFVQTLSVLLVGFALWSYFRFDTSAASVVSMGTIWSFVVTGGFVQAVGRLGRSYLQREAYQLAEEVCLRIVRAGAITTIVLVLPFPLLAYTGALPARLALNAAVYYLLLSALWLAFAVLYTLDRPMIIVGCIVAGMGVIWVLREIAGLDIYVAQWNGLGVTVVLAGVLGREKLAERVGLATDEHLADLPRRSLLAYLASPYLLYGALYFSFLYLDRVVAWTAGNDPLFLWFDTQYELGLDVALLALVLMLAQLEYTGGVFSDALIVVQEAFGGEARSAHNRWFRRFYLRQVSWLGVLAAVSVVLVHVVVIATGNRSSSLGGLFDESVVQSVYWLGAIGYAMLAVGLLNCIFLFSVSRVGFALRALGAGFVVNAAVGITLSRTFEPWCAVVGLTAGATTFAVVSGFLTLRVMGRLDYYYYSAS